MLEPLSSYILLILLLQPCPSPLHYTLCTLLYLLYPSILPILLSTLPYLYSIHSPLYPTLPLSYPFSSLPYPTFILSILLSTLPLSYIHSPFYPTRILSIFISSLPLSYPFSTLPCPYPIQIHPPLYSLPTPPYLIFNESTRPPPYSTLSKSYYIPFVLAHSLTLPYSLDTPYLFLKTSLLPTDIFARTIHQERPKNKRNMSSAYRVDGLELKVPPVFSLYNIKTLLSRAGGDEMLIKLTFLTPPSILLLQGEDACRMHSSFFCLDKCSFAFVNCPVNASVRFN